MRLKRLRKIRVNHKGEKNGNINLASQKSGEPKLFDRGI